MLLNFFRKIFLIDILEGLVTTYKYNFLPKATISYPEKVKIPSERFRGIIRQRYDDKGSIVCIACKLCLRTCPHFCFDIEGKKDENNKSYPVKFDWKLERCSFCGHCVKICPVNAIYMTKEFRMSTLDRNKLTLHLNEMFDDYDLQEHFLGERKKEIIK